MKDWIDFGGRTRGAGPLSGLSALPIVCLVRRASGKNRTQNYCEQDDPATGRHDREDQATSSGHYLSVQTTIGRGRRKGEPRRPLIARMADNGCGVGQASRLILG
jgi:hypothetical protein